MSGHDAVVITNRSHRFTQYCAQCTCLRASVYQRWNLFDNIDNHDEITHSVYLLRRRRWTSVHTFRRGSFADVGQDGLKQSSVHEEVLSVIDDWDDQLGLSKSPVILNEAAHDTAAVFIVVAVIAVWIRRHWSAPPYLIHDEKLRQHHTEWWRRHCRRSHTTHTDRILAFKFTTVTTFATTVNVLSKFLRITKR